MKLNFIVKEKNTLEAEVEGFDTSLLNGLVEKLSGMKNVEFVAYKVDHPLVGTPKLIIKTKGSTDAASVAIKALEELEAEAQEFRKKFSEMLK